MSASTSTTAPYSKERANLDRIRENQRRSRARRKDYVADLERRLKSFELQGVAATVEVQKAAKKVLLENRSLRSLLHKHGVHDSLIDTVVQSEYQAETAIQRPDHQLPGQYRTGSASHSVQALENIMIPRRPNYLENQPSLSMMHNRQSRESSMANGTHQSPGTWQPATPASSTFPRASLPGTPLARISPPQDFKAVLPSNGPRHDAAYSSQGHGSMIDPTRAALPQPHMSVTQSNDHVGGGLKYDMTMNSPYGTTQPTSPSCYTPQQTVTAPGTVAYGSAPELMWTSTPVGRPDSHQPWLMGLDSQTKPSSRHDCYPSPDST